MSKFMLLTAWWDTLFVGLTRPLRAWGQMAVQDVGTFPVVRFESGSAATKLQAASRKEDVHRGMERLPRCSLNTGFEL